MKANVRCAGCGMDIDVTPCRIKNARHHYCSIACFAKNRMKSGTSNNYTKIAWNVFNRMEDDKYWFTDIERCYQREARAMLEGKHWEGKNRCVKLEGDP